MKLCQSCESKKRNINQYLKTENRKLIIDLSMSIVNLFVIIYKPIYKDLRKSFFFFFFFLNSGSERQFLS